MAPWKDGGTRPVIYHVLARVVDWGFRFHEEEKERFRMLMRMMEEFSGCRVLSFCLMSNHFHILLEVPPMPEEGLKAQEVFRRLRVLYADAVVDEIEGGYARAEEVGHEAARTMAAYIDLNPVRAGMVKDPADYRW